MLSKKDEYRLFSRRNCFLLALFIVLMLRAMFSSSSDVTRAISKRSWNEKTTFPQEIPQVSNKNSTNSTLQNATKNLDSASQTSDNDNFEETLNKQLQLYLFRAAESRIDISSPWTLSHFTRLHAELLKILIKFKSQPQNVFKFWRAQSAMKKEKSELIYKLETQLERFQKKLYPWLKKPILKMQADFPEGSKGIVYTTGKHHAFYTYISIKSIQALNCTTPVVIVYGGDNDLPLSYRKILGALPNVSFLDIHDSIEWEFANPGGWAIKPFAMLFAKFQHVMFIDSDVFFMENPNVLFDDPGYIEFGALFFHDRTLFPTNNSPGHVFFEQTVDAPSEYAKNMRHWTGKSQHEMESGVVVIDKRRTLLGLVAACSLNTKALRDEKIYKVFHGDKETFWVGYEMAAEKYSFMPGNGGSLGFVSNSTLNGKTSTCGALVHLNRQKRPLWFNGGLEVDKNSQPGRLITCDVYLTEETGDNVGWHFGSTSPDGFCISIVDKPAIPLNQKEKDICNLWKSYYLKFKPLLSESDFNAGIIGTEK